MPLPLVLAPIMLSLWPWRHAPALVVERHRLGAWTVETRDDRFAGRRTCRVTAPGLTYERGALVVRLGRRTDTADAVYRVDDGPPVAVRSELMDMARRGFAIDQDDLANPSGGVVRIPEARLSQARRISIRAGVNRTIVRVGVTGFAAALDSAHAAGCAPGDFTG